MYICPKRAGVDEEEGSQFRRGAILDHEGEERRPLLVAQVRAAVFPEVGTLAERKLLHLVVWEARPRVVRADLLGHQVDQLT